MTSAIPFDLTRGLRVDALVIRHVRAEASSIVIRISNGTDMPDRAIVLNQAHFASVRIQHVGAVIGRMEHAVGPNYPRTRES